MNNNTENVKKISNYIIISIVVLTFLFIIMFYRLAYLGSIGNIISAKYDFYTGILPLAIIGFVGIDIIFYLEYLRDKLSYNSVRHNLAMWVYLLFIFLFFSLILPLLLPSTGNRPQIISHSMLMINLITIGIPAVFSFSIPIYLLVTIHRFPRHI